MRRTLITLIAGLALIAGPALAGCAGDKTGGDDVATAGGTASASAAADKDDGDPGEQMRRFAQCMREHGVDMQDPTVDGEGRVSVGEPKGAAGPDDREKVEAAQQACKDFMPNGGEPPKMNPEDVEKVRAYAKCMRENGVPDFPDPRADGGLVLNAGPGTGIDPDSQTFKDAEKTCEQYMPRRPEAGGK